jgi:hypothetical protein
VQQSFVMQQVNSSLQNHLQQKALDDLTIKWDILKFTSVACSKESELKKNVLLVSELEKLLFLF